MMRDNNQQVRVTAIGMSQQNINILRIFFKGPCAGKYAIAENGDADINLVDLDGVTGQAEWTRIQRQFPGRPSIVQSVHAFSSEHAMVLRKPVEPELLKRALHDAQAARATQLRAGEQKSASNIINFEGSPSKQSTVQSQRRVRGATGTPPPRSVASVGGWGVTVPILENELQVAELPGVMAKLAGAEVALPSAETVAPTAQPRIFVNTTPAPEQIGLTGLTPALASSSAQSSKVDVEEKAPVEHESTGNVHPAVGLPNSSDLVHVIYNPEYYLQGYLKKALNLSYTSKKNVLLEAQVQSLIILYDDRKVLIEHNERALYAVGRVPINNDNIKISILSNSRHQMITEASGVLLDWDIVLWELAMRAAHGRIPIGTDITGQFYLKHMPDAERFGLGDSLRTIAELWHQQPCSLVQTLQLLDVSQQDIFSFYSAAKALGFVKSVNLHRPGQTRGDENVAVSARVLTVEEPEIMVDDDLSSDRAGGILKRLYTRIKGQS